MKLYVLFLIIAFASLFAVAQQADPGEWTTLASKKGEFSVSIPTGFIVYKDSRRNEVQFYSNTEGSSFTVTFNNTSDAKNKLKEIRNRNDNVSGASFFVSGDFDVDIHQVDKGTHQVWIYLASSKGLYFLNIVSKTIDDPNAAAALKSVLLNGKPMMKGGPGSAPRSGSVISADSVKTSQIFIDALNHKQVQEIEVDSDAVNVTPIDGIFYSRPLVILRIERSHLTAAAREKWMTGPVKLSVLFKGNGHIGKITVLGGSGPLADSCIETAKKIKFLPAEIDGKPVDVKRTIEYGFSL